MPASASQRTLRLILQSTQLHRTTIVDSQKLRDQMSAIRIQSSQGNNAARWTLPLSWS